MPSIHATGEALDVIATERYNRHMLPRFRKHKDTPRQVRERSTLIRKRDGDQGRPAEKRRQRVRAWHSARNSLYAIRRSSNDSHVLRCSPAMKMARLENRRPAYPFTIREFVCSRRAPCRERCFTRTRERRHCHHCPHRQHLIFPPCDNASLLTPLRYPKRHRHTVIVYRTIIRSNMKLNGL